MFRCHVFNVDQYYVCEASCMHVHVSLKTHIPPIATSVQIRKCSKLNVCVYTHTHHVCEK